VSAPFTFSASYDKTTKVVSGVACLVLLVAAPASRNRFVASVSAVVAVLAYAFSPRSYAVVGRTIIVNRLIGNVRIPLENLREARVSTPDDVTGCIRLWGSGGMFGYFGLFRTTKLGKCTWYVTRRDRMIVVATDLKTTLYSPDDTAGFLAAIRR
jgi:hypothetical protein